MTDDSEHNQSKEIAYYKEHREYVPPIHVCMVGGYYAEEDLPSISDECLDTMLGQSCGLVELFGRLSNKCTVEDIKKTFADTLQKAEWEVKVLTAEKERRIRTIEVNE